MYLECIPRDTCHVVAPESPTKCQKSNCFWLHPSCFRRVHPVLVYIRGYLLSTEQYIAMKTWRIMLCTVCVTVVKPGACVLR